MSEPFRLHEHGRSAAVLIGTWEYAHLPSVPAVQHSMERMYRLLTGTAVGWPKADVTLITNPATPGDLADRLMTAFEVPDVALFYYVGHGQDDHNHELCLGLAGSRQELNRRATTSLEYRAVREALRNSKASVKIVILDCCYSGIAVDPAHSPLGAQADSAMIALQRTHQSGAYVMTASSAYQEAWCESGSEPGRQPQTYFTKYLADTVEQGVPQQPAFLTLGLLFEAVKDRLVANRLPTPQMRSVNELEGYFFTRNLAPRETHRDPKETIRLQQEQIKALQAEIARYRPGEADQSAAEHNLHELQATIDDLRAAPGVTPATREAPAAADIDAMRHPHAGPETAAADTPAKADGHGMPDTRAAAHPAVVPTTAATADARVVADDAVVPDTVATADLPAAADSFVLPGTPAAPNSPATADTSAVADNLVVPGTPTMPGTVTAADLPAAADSLVLPGTPTTPDSPAGADNHVVPSTPTMPGTVTTADLPATPDALVLPGTPATPDSPATADTSAVADNLVIPGIRAGTDAVAPDAAADAFVPSTDAAIAALRAALASKSEPPVPKPPLESPTPSSAPGGASSRAGISGALRRLRESAGDPSMADIARQTRLGGTPLSESAVHEIVTGRRVPSVDETLAVARACGAYADETGRHLPSSDYDGEAWRTRHEQLVPPPAKASVPQPGPTELLILPTTPLEQRLIIATDAPQAEEVREARRLEGDGRHRDAERMLSREARNGSVEAKDELAAMYRRQGRRDDYIRALHEAKEAGSSQAAEKLERFRRRGDTDPRSRR